MSEITDSFLYNLPALVKDYIQTEPYFRDFAIIAEDDKEITADVDAALNGQKAGPTGKVGLAILINTARGGTPIPNTPDTFSEGARVLFEIVEVPKINRATSDLGTGQPGKVVAEVLAALMKEFASDETDWTNLHFYEGAVYLPEVLIRPGQPEVVIHEVLMLCNGGIEMETTVIAATVISNVGLLVTITSSGDPTLYTINGTRPQYFGDGNTNNIGTVYSVPFSVANNTTVKARAFDSFLQLRGSKLATKLIV
jgi:hypothetical protein